MHDFFAAWLRGVNVHLTNDVAKSRWAAVESLVRWVTESEMALHLAASAVAVASVDTAWRQHISRALQEGDASFPMMGNDAELQVLAASAVVQLFEDEGVVADVAALGVATGTFGNREPEEAPDLAALAQEYLRRRALNVRVLVEARDRASFTVHQAGYLTKLSNDVSDALAAEGSVSPETVEVLNKAVSKLKDYLTELAEAEFSAYNRMIESQTVLSEENDILWWLINGYSRELEKPRAQASTAELVLPSARELASLIAREVPPAASIEYLRHTLSSAMGEAPTQLTVMEVMGATAPEWRILATSVELPKGADLLFPLSTGLRIGRDAPDEHDWNCALSDGTGLSADFSSPPEGIGVHYLNELSLASRFATPDPREA